MLKFKEFLNTKVLSVKELTKKHHVPSDEIKTALKNGIKVEKEHTTKKDIAKQIALAHIGEDPKYYDKLKKVEKKNAKSP